MKNIYFMPLGGAQSVGASCYYLRLGERNLILDAGAGQHKDITFGPEYLELIRSPYIESLGQIDQIYISHAHMDHVGSLLPLMGEAHRANVYMTEMTRILSAYQLYDRQAGLSREWGEKKSLAVRNLLDRITPVSYLKTMDFGSYKVTCYPAGHIPGAMMTLFEFGKRNILYTGDYSIKDTLLTSGCMIPEGKQIDTLILCSLHAKHPEYTRKDSDIYSFVRYVISYVQKTGKSMLCYVPQLSKGVEFLKMLNHYNQANVPVYLDESIAEIVGKMEEAAIPVLSECNKISEGTFPREGHIYLTADPKTERWRYDQVHHVDFTLHEDFSEMKQFIKQINPKQVVLVHCGKEHSSMDRTIEQELIMDGECRSQFIFAEQGQCYQL